MSSFVSTACGLLIKQNIDSLFVISRRCTTWTQYSSWDWSRRHRTHISFHTPHRKSEVKHTSLCEALCKDEWVPLSGLGLLLVVRFQPLTISSVDLCRFWTSLLLWRRVPSLTAAGVRPGGAETRRGQDDVGSGRIRTHGHPAAAVQRRRQQPLGRRWLGQREQLGSAVRALAHQSSRR